MKAIACVSVSHCCIIYEPGEGSSHSVGSILEDEGHLRRCDRLGQQRNHQVPRLLIESASCRATATPARWLVAWSVQNLGQEPFEVLSTWLPHDKFSSGQHTITPPVRLLPQESTLLELPVVCHEPPESVVENAFVILRMRCLGQAWRAFVRLRVVVDTTGTPRHVCESVTLHPVGFSGTSGGSPPRLG